MLDASTVTAYAKLEGTSVGELIGSVHEDGDVTGIPVCARGTKGFSIHTTCSNYPDQGSSTETTSPTITIAGGRLSLLSSGSMTRPPRITR